MAFHSLENFEDKAVRFKTINRVNWICSVVDTVLTLLKLSVGTLIHSPALIADGLHSLSDLATDLLSLALGKLAQPGPDENHPYGHARYETIGTAILGTVLIVVALGIAVENLSALVNGEAITAQWFALIVVFISIISKETLFHYTMKYAKLTRSNLLQANAWHSRSDSLSSVVVFIGILGTLIGFPMVEQLAAITVAILIGWMGYKLAWEAIQDLIDRGVSAENRQKYIQTLLSITDIKSVHLLRSRLMGNDVFIDAHIQVDADITVSEAHQINDYAEMLLKREHIDITDVTLHADFESDHIATTTTLPPLREKLLALLNLAGVTNYQRCYIHYQFDQVTVELLFEELIEENFPSLCSELVKSNIWIKDIQLYIRK